VEFHNKHEKVRQRTALRDELRAGLLSSADDAPTSDRGIRTSSGGNGATVPVEEEKSLAREIFDIIVLEAPVVLIAIAIAITIGSFEGWDVTER